MTKMNEQCMLVSMNFLHAIILGIVEGVTEFLPISSTAHLILTSQVLRLEQTEFLKTFDVAIQLGAIAAVVVLYAKRVLQNTQIILRVLAAFVPTAIIGFILHDTVKKVFFESNALILWSLLLGGFVLIIFEWWHKEPADAKSDLATIPYTHAILIGIFQSFALVPGVSRAAATIIGGLLLGLKRHTIVEFSFLLAIPTMAAATGLDMLKTAPSFTGTEMGLLGVGFVTAFLTALAAVKWLLRYIRTHSFTGFGIYRVVIAILAWLALT
jgi:undecaprenyl-diphosphatase